MNRAMSSMCLCLTATVAIGFGAAVPAGAQDAMKAAPDCSKADTMMMTMPHSAMGQMQPSGDLDKDFAHSMMMHGAAMTAMLKAEVACGKDAKTKAYAQKLLDKDTFSFDELRLISGGPPGQ